VGIVVLFAMSAITVQYPVLAANCLGMVDGPKVRHESFGQHRLSTPTRTMEHNLLMCVASTTQLALIVLDSVQCHIHQLSKHHTSLTHVTDCFTRLLNASCIMAPSTQTS